MRTDKLIVSMRYDGFGSRVTSMLNAIYLAERLGLDFRFRWPRRIRDGEIQPIGDAETVFSSDFLNAFHDASLEARDFRHVKRAFHLSDLDESLEDPASRGILMGICANAHVVRGEPSIASEYPRLWQQIGFSRDIRSAEATARGAVPEGTVAVHLRRGDTVYGEARYRLGNFRFLPLAHLKCLIAGLKSVGRKVLLLSDDQRIVDMLSERAGVLTVGSLRQHPPASETAATVFDLTAMSSCKIIYGEQSAYSNLAAGLGQSEIRSPRPAVSREQALELVLADLADHADDYTTLDRAKELQFAALELSAETPDERSDELIREAIELDPDNLTYRLARACLLTRRGLYDEAEEVSRSTLTGFFATRTSKAENLLPYIFSSKEIGRAFEIAVQRGDYPFITALSSHREFLFRRNHEALLLAERAHELDPDSPIIMSLLAKSRSRLRRKQQRMILDGVRRRLSQLRTYVRKVIRSKAQ